MEKSLNTSTQYKGQQLSDIFVDRPLDVSGTTRDKATKFESISLRNDVTNGSSQFCPAYNASTFPSLLSENLPGRFQSKSRKRSRVSETEFTDEECPLSGRGRSPWSTSATSVIAEIKQDSHHYKILSKTMSRQKQELTDLIIAKQIEVSANDSILKAIMSNSEATISSLLPMSSLNSRRLSDDSIERRTSSSPPNTRQLLRGLETATPAILKCTRQDLQKRCWQICS